MGMIIRSRGWGWWGMAWEVVGVDVAGKVMVIYIGKMRVH